MDFDTTAGQVKSFISIVLFIDSVFSPKSCLESVLACTERGRIFNLIPEQTFTYVITPYQCPIVLDK